ncbi:fam-a protein [Plasmodium chabaudi chabaudi]|uniref:Fam-a protein n=1 Tax=Plasmodium chabaudi chabaudi TaxID=31271 RepID=A0A1C6YEA9_PLACU|nr:fam-a protein [Plasmodium chabaudi chabaudi]
MNKGYIKVVFFVLSLFVYVNNKVYAAEPASKKGAPQNKATQAKPPQVKETQAKPPQVKETQAKPSQVKETQAKPSQVNPTQAKPSQVKETQAKPSTSSTDKVSSDSVTLENDELDELYEQNKNLLCKYPEETEKVTKVMDEAIEALQVHARSVYGYTTYCRHDNDATSYYKQVENTDIGKLVLKFPDPNRYNEIINILWDPNGAKVYDENFIEGKVIRVYTPNLAMIQKRYDSPSLDFHGYFYALAKKVKVSENVTIITYSSANLDDHNSKDKEKYTNPLLKEINTFKTYINSDNYIRCGKLRKTFVNLAGFIIEKKDKHIDIICISSMDYRAPDGLSHVSKNVMLEGLATFIKLKQLLLKK